MAVFKNLNDLRTYMSALKEIDKAKEAGYALEIKKFHPVQTDKQQAYIHFMLSYFSCRYGQTFVSTLRELQTNICPHIFETGRKDDNRNPLYRPLSSLNTQEASSVIRNFLDYSSMAGINIPTEDDKEAISYCKREVESAGGWV